jgi:hypothetical protein
MSGKCEVLQGRRPKEIKGFSIYMCDKGMQASYKLMYSKNKN